MQYDLAVLVLAAGRSARFGANKLMSPHPQNKSLLGFVLQQYCPHAGKSVIVVTGAYHKELALYFADHPELDLHYNMSWVDGMGSSIAAGVKYIQSTQPDATHILIGLGDQPNITQASLGRLVAASKQSPQKMIASAWRNKLSAPAIFPINMAPQLVTLTGDRGAAFLLYQGMENKPATCIAVTHSEAESDIDTPADWLKISP